MTLNEITNFNNNAWIMNYLSSNQNNNADLFQNVILGILTFLIPLGIAILQFYTDKKIENEKKFNIELFAILDRVIFVRKLFLSSLFILIILAFFGLSYLSIILFFCYIFFVIFFPLKNTYNWLMSDRNTFIINFLTKLKVKKDKNLIFDSWESLWLKENLEREKEYTEIFCEHVNEFLKQDDYKSAVTISEIYLNNLEKRDYSFVLTIIFPNLLEWMKFEIKTKQKKSVVVGDTAYRDCYFKSRFILEVFKLVSDEEINDSGFFHIFDTIKKENDEEFLKVFFSCFFNFINKNYIESDKVDIDFFRNFPDEWKIKKENYNDLYQKIILNEFNKFRKLYSNYFLREYNYEKDSILNEIILEIFSEIHSGLFLNSLSLEFYPKKTFIKENVYLTSYNSRENGSPFVYSKNPLEGLYENQKKVELKTIELLKLILPDFYGNKQKLEKLKEFFEKVEFNEKEETEKERKEIALKIIDDFLETFEV